MLIGLNCTYRNINKDIIEQGVIITEPISCQEDQNFYCLIISTTGEISKVDCYFIAVKKRNFFQKLFNIKASI